MPHGAGLLTVAGPPYNALYSLHHLIMSSGVDLTIAITHYPNTLYIYQACCISIIPFLSMLKFLQRVHIAWSDVEVKLSLLSTYSCFGIVLSSFMVPFIKVSMMFDVPPKVIMLHIILHPFKGRCSFIFSKHCWRLCRAMMYLE